MMTDAEPLYEFRERTGTPEHPSVDDVVERVLERAQNPRADHQDAHLDEAMATVGDKYGSETVRTIIQRVLVEDYPFRTATADLEVDNIDGVRIGTTTVRVLEELHAPGDDCVRRARLLTLKTCLMQAPKPFSVCAKRPYRMGPRDELQRVQFHSPASLVERLDAIAEVYDTNRSALLVEALREYLEQTADSEPFRELVATTYYDDHLDFETVTQLVGGETAQRFRLLKADLDNEPLDLAAPDDVDVYDGDPTAVDDEVR